MLDLAYVVGLPASSKQLLGRELTILRSSGIRILLTNAKHLGFEVVQGFDDYHGISGDFESVDRAIEEAEDGLLESLSQYKHVPFSSGIDQTQGSLSLLQPNHRYTIASLMHQWDFYKGDQVIR